MQTQISHFEDPVNNACIVTNPTLVNKIYFPHDNSVSRPSRLIESAGVISDGCN